MDNMSNHQTATTDSVSDHLLVSRLYELTCEGGRDNPELESLDAIVYQRLLETYGDDSTDISQAPRDRLSLPRAIDSAE